MHKIWYKIVQYFKKRTAKFIKIGVSLILLLILFLVLNPLPYLLEWMLICKTPFQPVDIIRLDGTGGQLDQAVEFFHAGIVKGIWVNAAVPDRYKGVEIPICNYDFIMEELHKADVPDEAIYTFECEGSTLAERQYCFHEWMFENNFTSYMIQPSRLHTCLYLRIHHDTFPNDKVTLVMVPSKENWVMRKQIVNIHNTIIYWLYWYFISRPDLQQIIAENEPVASTQNISSLEPVFDSSLNTLMTNPKYDNPNDSPIDS